MLMYMFIYDLREERASPSVGRLKKLPSLIGARMQALRNQRKVLEDLQG